MVSSRYIFQHLKIFQSMEVLKDASATARLRFRGANGVIMVTTKKVKAGEKTKMILTLPLPVNKAACKDG